MNLWIRSQDREKIVNCNDIVVNGSSIIGYFDKDTEYEDLGTYKSKERALEVLDEIQKKINLINLGYDLGSPMIDLKNPAYIYVMPKD